MTKKTTKIEPGDSAVVDDTEITNKGESTLHVGSEQDDSDTYQDRVAVQTASVDVLLSAAHDQIEANPDHATSAHLQTALSNIKRAIAAVAEYAAETTK